MALTPPPTAGDPAIRADVPPAPAGRPVPLPPVPDPLAALRTLLRAFADALPELAPPAPETFAAPGAAPPQIAAALASWLAAVGSARGLTAPALAALADGALARSLAAPPPAPGLEHDLAALAEGLRTALAATAAPRAPPPLRVLVEELRGSVTEALGPVEPPPLPAPGEEAGNVASALVRWLGTVAAGAGVAPAALRAAVEVAFERTRSALNPEPPLPPLEAELARAHEVLAAALGRPPPGPREGLPIYRPDLPVLAGPRGRRPARAAGTPRPRPEAADEAAEREPPGEAPGEARAEGPALPDLKGPMELVRRYVEDLWSAPAGVAAQHGVYPLGLWDGHAWRGFADATRLTEHHEAARAALAAAGVARERIVLLRVDPVGGGIAWVHAQIERQAADGRALGEVETAALAVRGAHGWRIAVLSAGGAGP